MEAEQDLISSLTAAFVAAKSSSPYVSLRIWSECGELKYFLCNTPPKKAEQIFPSPSTPGNIPSRTRKKRRHPIANTSAQIMNNQPHSDGSSTSEDTSSNYRHKEKIAADSPRDEDVIEMNIPCHNRFDILTKTDYLHDGELKDIDQGCDKEADADIDNDEEDGVDIEEDEAGVQNRDDEPCKETLNRKCIVGGCTERVPQPWNLQCRDCWSKYPINPR